MFTCEVCASTFIRKDYLSRHIKSAHNGVKFACNICLKSSTRKYKLDQHTKNAHRGSVIQYAPPIIVGQPPASMKPANTPANNHVANIWDGAICDEELLEIMDDFENQGKKIHYSNIDKILGRYMLNFIGNSAIFFVIPIYYIFVSYIYFYFIIIFSEY